MAREVIVADACAMINLQRGQLLNLLPYLPYQLVMPAEVRLELARFMRADWSLLDGSGLRTFSLPEDAAEQAAGPSILHPQLSASDRACLAVARHHSGSILLTDDRQLRRAAEETQVPVHGSLWAVDQMAIRSFPAERLEKALRIWRDDVSTYLPESKIDKLLKRLRQTGRRSSHLSRSPEGTRRPASADAPRPKPADPD